MKNKTLGIKKLQISNLGLGCMGMSECYGKTNDLESVKILHRAFEVGITHFDTADCYGLGHNERLLAGGFRDNVVIASKFGMVRNYELEENVNAADLNLSPAELLQIEQHIPPNFAHGDLLPESFAKLSEQ